MTSKSVIKQILEKLAPDSSDDKLSKKGDEFLRLFRIKRGAGMSDMSEICATIVCLNLAADKLGCSFDKAEAVQMAMVKKNKYASLYRTVEKVLELDKPVSPAELCVRMGFGTDIADLAGKLRERYVRSKGEGAVGCSLVDLSHPMYACAAVLAAARHIKVTKPFKRGPLMESCGGIRVKDLDRLAGEMAALVGATDRPAGRKRGHTLIDMVEDMVRESQKTVLDEEKEEEVDREPQESFEEWKKRLLEKAAKT